MVHGGNLGRDGERQRENAICTCVNYDTSRNQACLSLCLSSSLCPALMVKSPAPVAVLDRLLSRQMSEITRTYAGLGKRSTEDTGEAFSGTPSAGILEGFLCLARAACILAVVHEQESALASRGRRKGVRAQREWEKDLVH